MDDIKKKYQIVVSRYNEDISWLLLFKNITLVYNKGNNEHLLSKFDTIQLPNVGRESHTYLYHIVQNYDNLAEKTIFFQGKINDHKILDIEDYFKDDLFIAKFNKFDIEKLKVKISHIGKWKSDLISGKMRRSNYIPYVWLSNCIGIAVDDEFTKIVWGANFSIHRDLILSKPKIFYENILRYIDDHINPEEGHFLERSWYMIFHNNFIPKTKIGYIENNNLNNIDLINTDDYEEIHLWINYIPNKDYNDIILNYTIYNKYIKIFPLIENNIFNIMIKGNNDAHILIEFEETEFKYEFIFGGWSNSRSVIRDYNNNSIIYSFEGPILDKYKFINFEFNIDKQIVIKKDNIPIFSFENTAYFSIKNIKIKSYFDSDVFWDYRSSNLKNNKIKYYLKNDIYQDIKKFYNNNYLDYFIEKIS